MNARGLAIVIAAAVLLFGCNVVLPPSGQVATLQLAAIPASVTAGDFVSLGYTAKDNAGAVVAGRTPTFSSSNLNVIRITTTGVLMAVGPGTATLTARLDRGTTQATVTVGARAIPAGQVQFFFGPEETVFNYATQKCEAADVPDNQARAVRLADGSIVMLAANDPHAYLMRGADFDHLARDCHVSLSSGRDPTPQAYHNREWLWSLYRVGPVIHALLHNEYHDAVATGCKPGDDSPANPCWYNSTTYARSTDNGATFRPPSGAFLVAPAPNRWDPADASARSNPQGYFTPSNIVRVSDGFYYALLPAAPTPNIALNACVMRTRTLDDPASWRAWNGSAFALAMTSPYNGPAPAGCTPVVSGDPSSLTYNTYLAKYVAVSSSGGVDDNGAYHCGVAFSISGDLVRWTSPKLILPMARPVFNGANYCPDFPTPPNNNQIVGSGLYASFLDHGSQSINFETAAQTPYLYNTVFTSATNQLARNLVRRPVIILKSPTFTGDMTRPNMDLQVPTPNQTISGSTFLVIGWAYDDVALARVEILIDGLRVADATTGVSRPDVQAVLPEAGPNSGYRYVLNTFSLTNGPHTITARAVDTPGNATAKTVTFTVSN